MTVRGATGGLIGTSVVICGGRPKTDNCYVINGKQAGFLGKMTTKRSYAASVIINSKLLWITGGLVGGNILASSEFVSLEGTAVFQGIEGEYKKNCFFAIKLALKRPHA